MRRFTIVASQVVICLLLKQCSGELIVHVQSWGNGVEMTSCFNKQDKEAMFEFVLTKVT